MNFSKWLLFNLFAISTLSISPTFASEAYQYAPNYKNQNKTHEGGEVGVMTEQPAHGENPRFVPYETNTAVGQHTWGDENSIDVNYSFRYYIYRPDNDTPVDRLGLFFSYTGEFDFYAHTRESSPVVNRFSNPAFHYRLLKQKCITIFCPRWVDLAIEHFSNGQTLDAKANQATLQDAYNNDEHKIFDSISRAGAQYALTGEVKYPIKLDKPWKNFGYTIIPTINELYLKGLIRFEQDAGVYWGPYANSNVDFNDFQSVIVTWRSIYGEKKHASDTPVYVQLAWSIGLMGLATDSMNVLVSIPFRFDKAHHFFCQDEWLIKPGTTIPFAVTAHFGPMNTLSNYTQTQRSIGVGLSFDY